MLAYVDSSVVLRMILFEQPSPLAEWDQIDLAVSSTLLAVECHRSLDRYWREDRLSDSGACREAHGDGGHPPAL